MSKARRAFGRSRRPKLRVVKDVEKLGPELKFATLTELTNWKILEERKVEVNEIGSIERASCCIPQHPGRRVDKAGRIKPLVHRWIAEFTVADAIGTVIQVGTGVVDGRCHEKWEA